MTTLRESEQEKRECKGRSNVHHCVASPSVASQIAGTSSFEQSQLRQRNSNTLLPNAPPSLELIRYILLMVAGRDLPYYSAVRN